MIALDGLSVLKSGTCTDKDARASEIGGALPGTRSKVSEALAISVVGVLAISGVSVVFAAGGIFEAENVAMGKAEVERVDTGLSPLVDLTEEGAFV